MGLNRDHNLVLVCPLSGCSCLICGQKSSGFFLAEVAQNSFSSFLEARSQQSRWCGHAKGNCASCCHCSTLVLKLDHAWVLFFVAQVCVSAGSPIC
jgi:hypothetical protein